MHWSQRVVKVILPLAGCGGGFRRGGVAGAEPPHKGGPSRPDRPEEQGRGAGGQGLVNGERRLSAKRREETRKTAAGRQSPSRAFADRGVEVEEICNET